MTYMGALRESPDAEVARIAARQHGVVTLRQLRTQGIGTSAINHRVRCGRLHRLHRGIFAVGHDRLTRKGHWLAAVFAYGDGAALSHVSGAALWEVRHTAATRIHVTVPTAAGIRPRAGIALHRTRALRPADIEKVDGIPVTSVARTLLDLSGMLAPGPLERAVEQSLTLRLFDLADVRAQIDAGRTRPGAGALERIVATIHDEPPLTRSELEALMRDLCDEHGLARPRVNTIVEGEEVDFSWSAQRLIVETDGRRFHGTRSAFERDRARDARLTVLGYRVVRFTHRQLTRERERVAATLVALLAEPRGYAAASR